MGLLRLCRGRRRTARGSSRTAWKAPCRPNSTTNKWPELFLETSKAYVLLFISFLSEGWGSQDKATKSTGSHELYVVRVATVWGTRPTQIDKWAARWVKASRLRLGFMVTLVPGREWHVLQLEIRPDGGFMPLLVAALGVGRGGVEDLVETRSLCPCVCAQGVVGVRGVAAAPCAASSHDASVGRLRSLLVPRVCALGAKPRDAIRRHHGEVRAVEVKGSGAAVTADQLAR
jgi:hypothetical protein